MSLGATAFFLQDDFLEPVAAVYRHALTQEELAAELRDFLAAEKRCAIGSRQHDASYLAARYVTFAADRCARRVSGPHAFLEFLSVGIVPPDLPATPFPVLVRCRSASPTASVHLDDDPEAAEALREPVPETRPSILQRSAPQRRLAASESASWGLYAGRRIHLDCPETEDLQSAATDRYGFCLACGLAAPETESKIVTLSTDDSLGHGEQVWNPEDEQELHVPPCCFCRAVADHLGKGTPVRIGRDDNHQYRPGEILLPEER